MMDGNWQRNFALMALFAGVFLLAADLAEARRGGGRAVGVSRSGPASSGSVRSEKRETRHDVRSERRDVKKDVREEKRDTHRDRHDNKRDVRRDIRDDRRDFREDVYRDRSRVRAARAISATAFRNLSCRSEIIVVGNVTYYRCGSNWFQKAYHEGSVTYVIVTTPSGY